MRYFTLIFLLFGFSGLSQTISNQVIGPAGAATFERGLSIFLCEGASGNQLVNPSFEVPAQTYVGNNILTWPINGWTGNGSAPNVVKANGFLSTGGPVSAQQGVQYLDIASGSADFYQEFDFHCNVQVFFSGYFSVRDGQSSTGRIDILRVNSDNTTDIVAFSNQLNMPPTANIWYLASGDATLPTGKYRFNINMGNHSNFDTACFSFNYPNINTGSYGPLCESSSVTLTGTPTDSFGSWTGIGIADNGDGTASFNPLGLGGTTVSVTYSHFNASGFGCSQSTNISVNPNITPTFTQVPSICSGDALSALPTTSNDGITGVWTPALDNTTTTTYTFTPDLGECANPATLTITVDDQVNPLFTAVADICNGDVLAPLPTTSNNGVSGTWSPALDNTTTTTYTFTPSADECADPTTMIVVIIPVNVLTISAINLSEEFDTNQVISVTVSGGSGSYEYQLDNGLWQFSSVFEYVTGCDEHTVVVRDAIDTCNTESETTVSILEYPKFFTPNGDGFNDTWNIKCLKDNPLARIRVYDRFGKLLLDFRPSQNAWNGTFNGQRLPGSDYWFVANYLNSNGVEAQFRSHFSLRY